MKQIFFAVVYTVILVLGCVGVSFAQVEDTPSLVAKATISQSGGGAGFWQVSGTMTDESGYFDASNLQVGDFVFFTGQGLGFHLPITQIVSVVPPSFTVRVSNAGITAIVGVPTTVGAVYRASANNGLMPYTSGLSNPDQQTLVNYLVQRLDLITGGGGGGTVVTAAPVTGTGTEGNPITMAPATTSAPGSMSAADKVKLNAAITTLNNGTGISITGTAPALTVTSTVNAGQVPATATAPLTGTTVQAQLNELAGQTHAPATVTDSPTLDFTINGQNVTGKVNVFSGKGVSEITNVSDTIYKSPKNQWEVSTRDSISTLPVKANDIVKITTNGSEYLVRSVGITGYTPDTINLIQKGNLYLYLQNPTPQRIGMTANDNTDDSWPLQRFLNYSKALKKGVDLEFGKDTFKVVNISLSNVDYLRFKGSNTVFQFPTGTYSAHTTKQIRFTNIKQVLIEGITGDGQNRKGNTWTHIVGDLPTTSWDIICAWGDTMQQNYAVNINNCGFVNSRSVWLRVSQNDEFPPVSGRYRKGYNQINITNTTLISTGGGIVVRGLHNFVKIKGLTGVFDTTMIFGNSEAGSFIGISTEVTGHNYTRVDISDIRANYGVPSIFTQNTQSYTIDNFNINKGGYYLDSQGVEKRIREDFRNSPGDPYGYPYAYAVKVDNIFLAPQQTLGRISNLYLTNCAPNNFGGWNIVEGSADVRISNFAVSGSNYIRTEDNIANAFNPTNCVVENGQIDGNCGSNCVSILASDNVVFTNVKFRPRFVNGVVNNAGIGATLGFNGNTTIQNSTWEKLNFSVGASSTIAGDTINIMGCTFDGGYNLIQGSDPNNELLQNTSVINITESKNVGIRYINPATGSATQYDSLAINLRNTSAYFLGQNNTTPNSLSRLLDSPRATFDNVEIVDENGYGTVSWWPVTRAVSNTTLLNALNFATSGALTNPITVTIPSDRIRGRRVVVVEDAFGGISGANTISIVDAGGGTRFKRGSALSSTVILTEPYQKITLISDGSTWTVFDSHLDVSKKWTTSTRPVLGNEIVVGYNTTTSKTEYWNGTVWVTIPNQADLDAKQNNIQFQDETTNLGVAGTVNAVNFAGAGVTTTRTGNEITVTIPGGGGGGAHTFTDSPTVDFTTNGSDVIADVKSASLDSVQIRDGGVRLRELNQSGATNNQAPVWNGTIYAPATVDVNPTDDITGSVGSGQVPFGTGTNAVTGNNNLRWNNPLQRFAINVPTGNPAGTLHVRGVNNLADSISFLVENNVNISSAWATNSGNFFMGRRDGNRWAFNSNGAQFTNGVSIANATITAGNLSFPFSIIDAIGLSVSGTWSANGTNSAMGVGRTFSQSANSNIFHSLDIRPIINQTGTANGAIYGLRYNPTLTGLLGQHYAATFLTGNVGVGTETPLSRFTNTTNAYFGGNAAATAFVHLAPGTTTTPPMRLSLSGTVLNTTTLPGAIETNGNDRVSFVNLGGTRRNFAYTDELPNLDQAYNNFRANAAIIRVDSAQGQTEGLEIESIGNNPITFDLQGIGDFRVQDAGTNIFRVANTGYSSAGTAPPSTSQRFLASESASSITVPFRAVNVTEPADGVGVMLPLRIGAEDQFSVVAFDPVGSYSREVHFNVNESGSLVPYMQMNANLQEIRLNNALSLEIDNQTAATVNLDGRTSTLEVPSTASTTVINLPEIVSIPTASGQVRPGYVLYISIDRSVAVTINRAGTADVLFQDGQTSTTTSISTTGGTFWAKRLVAVGLDKWVVF
jgi:hypothetical protein